MNYTQSFDEFAMGLGPTDLALYAGAGIILYILFKDKLSPVQKMVLDLFEKVKGMFESKLTPAPKVEVPPVVGPVVRPVLSPKADKNEVFFSLVASWKQTRDLAEKYRCSEAVKSLDDTFQYLAPTVCGGNDE
jgi:hypothetical protein